MAAGQRFVVDPYGRGGLLLAEEVGATAHTGGEGYCWLRR